MAKNENKADSYLRKDGDDGESQSDVQFGAYLARKSCDRWSGGVEGGKIGATGLTTSLSKRHNSRTDPFTTIGRRKRVWEGWER